MGSKKKFILFLLIVGVMCGVITCLGNNKEQVVADKSDEEIIEEVEEEEKKHEFKKVILECLSDSQLYTKRINFDENAPEIIFDDNYSDIEGVLTFRGNNFRSSPSFGKIESRPTSLEKKWSFRTSSSSWGGGAGWTGQAAIVKWTNEQKKVMNLSDDIKNDKEFKEVIYASLDGNIYFLNSETGEKTRDHIRVGNPMKGSLSVDPRGLPLLYVGEGINENGSFGFNIYSLIDGKKLYEIDNDPDAPRGWGAFDSSAIVHGETDSVIIPGENGIIYKIKLNTNFDKDNNSISINPNVTKYIYDKRGQGGVESSIVTYANLGFFADNSGYINCIDLNKMMPIWSVWGFDDIDATLTLDIEEDDKVYLYCGNEVDKQGSVGLCKIKKIDAMTGEFVWEKDFKCESLIGKDPVNGGMLSTPVVGKNNIDNISVFSISRYGGFNSGLLVALDKTTGEMVWEFKLDNYAWSSPVDVYDEEGNGYIVQCDSVGNIFILDGKTGEVINKITLDANIEASPVVFNNEIFVATRGGNIYRVDIK